MLREKGYGSPMEIPVPEGGREAIDITRELGIPDEMIEAVFRNGLVQNVHDRVYPGDRVAFVPPGTPGPYRFLLGMVRENVERTRREKKPGGPGSE